MLREPVVAGMFYPAEKTTLQEQHSTYFQAPQKTVDHVRAIIAPHAGYVYSGQVAAHAYKQLENEAFDVIFVLAPSHHVWANESSVYAAGNYKTPLGEIAVDQKCVEKLRNFHPQISFVPEFHQQEHALEVQLPFLQYMFPSLRSSLRIVPVVMSGELENAEIMKEAILQCAGDKKFLVVASSDLSHYHDYETARGKDIPLLEAIVSLETETVTENTIGRTWEMCGQLPVLTLMKLAEHFGWTGHLLQYANSGDTAGDKERVVGYGAVCFSESKEE